MILAALGGYSLRNADCTPMYPECILVSLPDQSWRCHFRSPRRRFPSGCSQHLSLSAGVYYPHGFPHTDPDSVTGSAGRPRKATPWHSCAPSPGPLSSPPRNVWLACCSFLDACRMFAASRASSASPHPPKAKPILERLKSTSAKGSLRQRGLQRKAMGSPRLGLATTASISHPMILLFEHGHIAEVSSGSEAFRLRSPGGCLTPMCTVPTDSAHTDLDLSQ